MKFNEFSLERHQSRYENTVKYNLTESGVHPFTLQELLPSDKLEEFSDVRLGYGQTNGTESLRNEICKMYSGGRIDNVVVTNGSAEANFVLMNSIIEQGDEVIIILPNYMQIHGAVQAIGANVKTLELKQELNWSFDLEELQNLVNVNTKLISVCNPNNPTGAVFTEKEMNQLVKLSRLNNCWLVVDEVYRGAELSGDLTSSFYGKYEKVIVTGGLSKAFSLPGLRIGWIVGPREVVENAWSYHDYTSITAGILSNFVAEYALTSAVKEEIFLRNREILNPNLVLISRWLQNHADLFSFTPPKAGGFCFIKYNFQQNSSEFCEELRIVKSVLLIPGDCFGMDGYLRIGIGSEKAYLEEGLALVSEYLNEKALV